MKRIILASASPRRDQIMDLAGIRHEVIPSLADETVPEGTGGKEMVEILSERKALDVINKISLQDSLVIGSDTVVEYGEKIYGKPKSEEDAVQILRTLSGTTHHVHTGICVTDGTKTVTRSTSSAVKMTELDDQEIRDYVASGEPMDKAGAYGIQGKACRFIERIDGDYFSIIGLPVSLLYHILRNEFNIDL